VSVAWRGCHGVRLREAPPVELGQCHGTPLADATLSIGPVPEPVGDELWRLAADVDTAAGRTHAEQRLWLEPDGSIVLRTNRGAALAVDAAARTITASGPDDGAVAQLVATYGFPLLLQPLDVVVVHAAAVVRGDQAVLVAGPSGSGKSSTLVRLVEAGWQAVSEDLCSVDLRGGAPVVWPGPPWVRRLRGEPGPDGAVRRFDTLDKVVWDIAPWQTSVPARVERIVLLDRPGDRTEINDVPRATALALLADHALWLGRPSEESRVLFPRLARLSADVPVVRLRLPRTPSWLDDVPDVFAKLLP
jgi:hypothetical protein